MMKLFQCAASEKNVPQFSLYSAVACQRASDALGSMRVIQFMWQAMIATGQDCWMGHGLECPTDCDFFSQRLDGCFHLLRNHFSSDLDVGAFERPINGETRVASCVKHG